MQKYLQRNVGQLHRITRDGYTSTAAYSVATPKIVVSQTGVCDLRYALVDPAKGVQLEATSRLAMRGDVGSISSAVKTLITPPPNTPEYILQNLRVGIRDGARAEAVVPELTKLLNVKEDETREAAVEALRYIASQSAIDPLKLALSDPDKRVRFLAVVGLATITNQRDYLPNIPDFRADETKYLAYWKSWSNTH